jgi:hypothetical protein
MEHIKSAESKLEMKVGRRKTVFLVADGSPSLTGGTLLVYTFFEEIS